MYLDRRRKLGSAVASDADSYSQHHREHDERIAAAWAACGDVYTRYFMRRRAASQSTVECELIFCLLSGHGVSFELASSAADVINSLGPFDPGWSDTALEHRVWLELTTPQFNPARRDGRLRRYRYPKRKTAALVTARSWLFLHEDLLGTLVQLPELERREFFTACPGIGLKTAGWLLRNLGLAESLAIIDVHVARALKGTGRVEEHASLRSYETFERAYLDWCQELGASAAAFDLFLWDLQRGTLHA